MGTISNFDIDEYFNKSVTFPKDRLSKTLKDGDIFIVNSEDSSGKGKHWVALKCINGLNLYMDSFGAAMLPECLELCKRNGNETIYNVYRIQDLDSNKCGLFCITFLEDVYDFDSYNKWLLMFSPYDFEGNDRIALERFK